MKAAATDSISKKVLTALSLLSGAGLVISLVQTSHFFDVRQGLAGFDSFCRIGAAFDCNAIDASPYAELFAGLPLSGAAAGWFLAILGLTLLARSAEFAPVLYPWVLGMSAVGSIVSVIYLGIMVRVLQVGCLLCLGVDLVNWSSLALLLVNRPRAGGRSMWSSGDLKTGAWITAISLGLAIVVSKGMQGEAPTGSDIDERVASILAAEPVAVNLPRRLTPASADGAGQNAKITIVKFSDFQCPSCRVGAQTLHPVLRRYEGKVRFVYRNFPLDSGCNRMIQRPMHPHACELAAGAICAEQQQKFEAYYQQVFEEQPTLAKGSALEIARRTGMDAARFEACLTDPATLSAVNQDVEEGITLNVESTPTFFVNGRRVSGAQPPEVWNRVIESLLR
jgi:protein-disulfide isomerase/uncharacterized membrane protein